MRIIIAGLLLSLVVLTGCKKEEVPDVEEIVGLAQDLVDARDGEVYRTIRVDNRIWMAENLRYESPTSLAHPDYSDEAYGRLYTWKEATNFCPDGWRLPEDIDWLNLMRITEERRGEVNKIGVSLKSTTGWTGAQGENNNGDDMIGFSAYPAGFAFLDTDPEPGFGGAGTKAVFWSATEDPTDNAIANAVSISSTNFENNENLTRGTRPKVEYWSSCRCVREIE